MHRLDVIDERLREREFGILDQLTTMGVRELFPEQAEFRRRLGKFYHRRRVARAGAMSSCACAAPWIR